jgi:hypothetical protein
MILQLPWMHVKKNGMHIINDLINCFKCDNFMRIYVFTAVIIKIVLWDIESV